MSKLSRAKDDLMFLKRRLKEKEEDCNSLWYDDLEEDYIKREIKGLKRLIHYTEHYIYTEQMKKNLKYLKEQKDAK